MGRIAVLTVSAFGRLLFLVPFLLSCGAGGEPPAEEAVVPSFDGRRAFDYLERQVAFGPRVPGTDPHIETRDWLVETLEETADVVMTQPFEDTYAGTERRMYNIIASLYPQKTSRILLCAHWDSRPMADEDPDPANHTRPVPGANDGASGVAILLHAAEIIAGEEPALGVDIVLFDGEDGGTSGDNSTWLLGSRHFARSLPEGYRPRFALLVDLVGDRDLGLTRDRNSMFAAPALWTRVEEQCEELGIPFTGGEMYVLDDHVPLIERGIRAVDIIDFDYDYWHTVEDTPDKCSPETLDLIGSLVLNLVYGEAL